MGGQTNLYAYCGNSPTNATDPMGTGAIRDFFHYWFPHLVDASLEAVKVPVPVGPAIEALEAGPGLYDIGYIREAQQHLMQVMANPASTEAQIRAAEEAVRQAIERAHHHQHH